MSDINSQALREAAEKAGEDKWQAKKINGDLAKYLPILSALDRYGLLDLKFDKILKEGKTQSVSQLEQILKDKKRNTGGSTRSTPSNSNIKIDDSDIRQIYK